MALANTQAILTRSPIVGNCFLTTAETADTAPTNIERLISAEGKPNGVRVRGFMARGRGTTAADKITLWLYEGSNTGTGQDLWYWEDFLMAAGAPGAEARAARAYYSLEEPFTLPENWEIWASCYSGESFNVFAYGADFEKITA